MMTAVLLALGSCAKDLPVVEPVGPGTDGEGPERIISASFGPASKSTLNADGVTPEFTDGDLIMVANGVATQVCTLRVGGGLTTFRTTLGGPLTAVYPKDAAVVSGNDITGVKVLSEQTGLFKDANIAKAVNVTTHATFDNQTAVLRFYVDASIGVKSITITSGSGNIATGAAAITVDPDEALISTKTTVNPDPRLCYVAVLPDSTTPKNLTFTSITTTQGTVTRTTTATLETNGMYNAFIPYYISIKVGSSPDVYQKWGYCNVGAFLPEDYGKYFAWGDTVGQYAATTGDAFAAKPFSWANCPHTDGTYSDSNKAVFTRYTASNNAYAKSGIADGKTVLDLADDAAHVNWGDDWRMPTGGEGGEFEALKNGTTGTWTTVNGVNGRKFSGAGNNVFFPAAGYGDDATISGQGSNGFYWSCTLGSNPHISRHCFISSGELQPSNENHRRFGRTIRPIYIQDIGSGFDTYTDEGNI